MVIAIDGPAGAGKTTVAKKVAKDLHLRFLDTGAMYRCVALKAIRKNISPDDGDEAVKIAASCAISFGAGEPQKVLLGDEDVTVAIRAPEIGDFASAVSVHPALRRILVEQQKGIVAKGDVVLEGRDTTTVVAPNAALKVFLTASIEERARRRYKELAAKSLKVHMGEIEAQIRERDERDSTREDSPLRVAEDAVVINTDQLRIQEVVDRIEQLAANHALRGGIAQS